ncbi:MAG: DUF4397 domain-containing protein [Gemmatimonadaceae bacterium]|nr:DUF4397 domain-containing protein [Gemmatimonadaceae bacterium]
MNKPFTFLLAAAVLATGACQKDSSPIKTTSDGETNVSSPADSMAAKGKSLVRIVNATRGGDVSVQLSQMPLFNDVKPGSVTDYREVANNLGDFSVFAAGNTAGVSIAEEEKTLLDGNRYSVFLIAEDVSKSILKVVKDEVIPDSGKARLRVFHAAPGAPEFDISVVGATQALFSGVGFKNEAGYADVAPALVTLQFRAKGESKVLLTIPKLDLKRGTATTVVVTGAGALSYFTFVDALMAPTPKS